MAAYHGRVWAVSALLKLGADRLATNGERQRPFEVARHDEVRCLMLPLTAGSDSHREDSSEKCPEREQKALKPAHSFNHSGHGSGARARVGGDTQELKDGHDMCRDDDELSFEEAPSDCSE